MKEKISMGPELKKKRVKHNLFDAIDTISAWAYEMGTILK